jgi:hypothetical protein
MGKPLNNCVKLLDCQCELDSEVRMKTGNELLLSKSFFGHGPVKNESMKNL